MIYRRLQYSIKEYRFENGISVQTDGHDSPSLGKKAEPVDETLKSQVANLGKAQATSNVTHPSRRRNPEFFINPCCSGSRLIAAESEDKLLTIARKCTIYMESATKDGGKRGWNRRRLGDRASNHASQVTKKVTQITTTSIEDRMAPFLLHVPSRLSAALQVKRGK